MSPHRLCSALLAASMGLSGCAPDAGDSAPSVPPVFACDPEVRVPTGTLSGPEQPASPDEGVYGAEPAPFFVHQGLPGRDASTDRSFLWRTDVGTLASGLEIGPAEGFPVGAARFGGWSFLFGGANVGEGPNRQHEARLCGVLAPDTTYSYRVGGPEAWSEVYTFTTPGVTGSTRPTRIAFVGDSRGDYLTWAFVAAAIRARSPDLVVFSGDMVELGQLQSEWNDWFRASGDLFANVPLIAAHGNHELLAQQYFVQFGLPGNEEWFSIDWNNIQLVTLNDTVRDQTETTVDQVQFMEREFAGAPQPWRIVNHHQAVYSTSTAHGSREDLRAAWAPVWEAADVDLVVAGHNHLYERSRPITAGQERASGITYLVSGGAGAPLYTTTEPEWFGLVARPIYHYVIADVSPESIDTMVYDIGGNVIDQFSLSP